MITPGLYRHYKGNAYRVLFVAVSFEYACVNGPLVVADDDLTVYVSDDHGMVACLSSEFEEGKYLWLTRAKWSGNGGANDGDRVVIYVSLSGEGRVSARTEAEFEESVGDGAPSMRFQRIGE